MSPINFSHKNCFQTFSFRKRDRISTQKDGKKITLHSAGDINIRKAKAQTPVPFNLPGGRRYMSSNFKSILSKYFTNNFRNRHSGHEQRILRDQASATLRRQGILNTQPSNLQ